MPSSNHVRSYSPIVSREDMILRNVLSFLKPSAIMEQAESIRRERSETMDRSERIALLRREALDPVICRDEFYYLFYDYFFAHEALAPEARYAESLLYAFSSLTPSISDGELIVGKCDLPLAEEKKKILDESFFPMLSDHLGDALRGQNSHMAVDYELLLAEGTFGIRKRIAGLKRTNPASAAFYDACETSLRAVEIYAAHYAETARRLSKETSDPIRRDELRKIASVMDRVPALPAESFYEAVESVHFLTHCLTLDPFHPGPMQFQLGRPDRYLLPYYEKDLASGAVTREDAKLLIDLLAIQINRRVPNGLSSGYMVCGRDRDGRPVANDLSLMLMEAVDDVRLVYPSVGFCWTPDMPEICLETACRLLLKGRSHPAIFNDDLISRGLVSYGIPEKDSREYIHSTCVEITPVGASNVWVASPYTNLPGILLDVMDREYDSFESLTDSFFRRLDMLIREHFEEQRRYRASRESKAMNPLLSAFVNDCLADGTDIEKGGARVNWIMPSFVGCANLVDALYAVNELVFRRKELSVLSFRAILDRNYEGYEALRLRILTKLPKYGNDDDRIDPLFSRITQHIAAECGKYATDQRNGRLIPSVFCWVMHERFGRETGATPDGRTAGFPLGDGSGPCQGREAHGPTASILSSTKWDHMPFIGGVAVNLKFSRDTLGKNAPALLAGLIRTYMERGGFELQINVVDRETLEDAVKRPELHQDLVVRIGGYSDYFVRLSPEMQQEILLRTAHDLA